MSFDIDVAVMRGGRRIALRLTTDARVAALLGPSGAGKTSVLDMVAGLLRPDAGRIAVAGATLFDAAAGIDLPPERRGVGYVFQDGRLFPHLSVRRNLLYGWRLAGEAARWTTPEAVLETLGIGPLLERRVRTLSGGEAQRVAIGRALLAGARLLLLDEPLSAIDPARREALLDAIERIRDEARVPILYVTHQEAEAERLADVVVRMAG